MPATVTVGISYAIRASGNHQKETMNVLFTHTWTWAHQKRRSDPEYRFWYNSNNLGCLNKNTRLSS